MIKYHLKSMTYKLQSCCKLFCDMFKIKHLELEDKKNVTKKDYSWKE